MVGVSIHIDKDLEQGSDEWLAARCGVPVSYTHLTLPTIYSV